MVDKLLHWCGGRFFRGLVDQHGLVGHSSQYFFFPCTLYDVGVIPEDLVESGVADAGQHVLARFFVNILVEMQIYIVHVVEYGLAAHVTVGHAVSDALHLCVAFVVAVVYGQVNL